MSAPQEKVYVVAKRVKATSISDALRREKKISPETVCLLEQTSLESFGFRSE